MPGLPVPTDMATMAAAWPAARIIQDPLSLVDDMFAIQPTTAYKTDWSLPAFIQQQLNPPPSPTSPATRPTHVPQLTLTPAATPPIPPPSHATLVHLRCVVQNTHSSDYYPAAYRTASVDGTGTGWRTGRYRDCVAVGEGEGEGEGERVGGGVVEGSVVTMERMDVTVVALAGENEWVKRALSTGSGESQQRGSDGQRRSARKRQLQDEEESSTTMEQDATDEVQSGDAEALDNINRDSSKKTKAVQQTGSTSASTLSSAALCIVTLYGSHCHSLRVGDVVEVVGIYSITPYLLQDDDELGHNAIHSSHHIHCLTLQRCSPPFVALPPPHSLLTTRSTLLSHLTAVCGGDSVAASLLLLCFISRVQKRSAEGVMGKLAVELTGSSSAFVERLTNLYAHLLTHSITLPITNTTLSTTPLYPTKDYTTNQLTPSPLLLPPTACLLLDATGLVAGQLPDAAVGVRNVRALGRLLEEQVLVHDFVYHEVLVGLDVSAVVLSGVGCTGLLFSHVSLPLCDAANESAGVVNAVTESEWDVWRRYVSAVNGDSVNFHVSESVGGAVERLFVERRRSDGEAVQAEWLHRVLLVARLVVRSYGEEELSEVRLMEAVRLLDEVERRGLMQGAAVTR